MDEGRARVRAPAIDALADAELFGLRLAAQVLGHKAALAGRPVVASYFADLESVLVFELARRGVGVVLGEPPQLALPADATPDDGHVLVEYLDLLAGNEQLSGDQRDFCRALRMAVVE